MIQKRIIVFLLLFAVVAVPLWTSSTIQAQDGAGTVFCGQLSTGDCAILTGSQEAMAGVTSAAVDGEMSLNLSGLEVTDGVSDLTLMLTLNGAAEADFTAFNQMQSSMMDLEGMTELMQDPNAMLALVLEYMAATESLVNDANANLTVEFSMVPVVEDGPELITVEMRMTEGVFYIKQQPLADQLDLPGPVDAEWAAIDIGTALEDAFAEGMADLDLSELADMEVPIEDIEALESLLDNELVTIFSDPEFLNEFYTVTRLEDQELNGQTMAVFESTIDLRELLLSSTFSDAVFSFLEEVQEMDPEATEDLGFSPAELQLVLTLVGSMIGSAEFTTIQWIGIDDLLTYHTEGSLNFEVDLGLLAGGDPSVPESISITGDMRIDISNINEPVEVTVPEDVQFYDPEDLE